MANIRSGEYKWERTSIISDQTAKGAMEKAALVAEKENTTNLM